MATGDKVYIADKQTLDELSTKVGATNNTGGSATSGTVFGKLNAIISSIASFVANWTSARAEKVDKLDNLDVKVSTRQSEQNAYDRYNILQQNTGVNNTASATGTLSQKLSHAINTIATRQSESDAASRYNQLNTNTGVNNTASATGTLSQKISHAINTIATRQSETDAASRYSTLNTNTATNNTASATGTLSQKLSHIINLFSTNKQKHLASKTVSVTVTTTGAHTLLNVTGAGQFFVANVNYMGDNYAPITFEIDGVSYTYRDYSGSSYYIAQTLRFPSKILDFFNSYTDNAPLMIPIYFTQSFKVTVNVSNAATRAFAAQYALYE